MALEDRADAYTDAKEDEERYNIEIWAGRLTNKTIFDKGVIRRLEETRDAITYGRIRRAVRNQAKALGITMKEIDQHLKDCGVDKFKPKPRTQNTAQGAHTVTLPVNGEGVSLDMGAWEIKDGKIIKDLGDHGVILACRGKVLIARRLKNKNDGTEYFDLVWQENNGPVQKQTVPRATIASKAEILKIASKGLPVSSDVAGPLVSYLADLIENNEIPQKDCTSQMGWDENMQYFAPYDDAIQFYDTTQSLLSKSVMMKSGTYEAWLDMIKKIRQMERIEPRICLAAAFAAPIVQMVHGQTGVVNLSGETEAGKSVSMTCGASIYGCPEKGYMIVDAGSTANAAEGAMETMKHLPVFFDDLSRLKNADVAVQDLIYTVCTECSKPRKLRDASQRRILTWRTIVQTNYERDLTSLNAKDGMQNRAFDFHCAEGKIFGENTNPSSTEVMTTLLENYGHAGEKWIGILKNLGAEKIKEEVDEMRRKLKQAVEDAGDKPKAGKQLNILTLIMVADKLSNEYIFQDGMMLPMDRMLEACKDEKAVFEPAKAYELTGELVEIHRANFETDADNNHLKCYGNIDEDGEWVNIIPSILRGWGKEYNFSSLQLCKWLINHHPDLIEVDHEADRDRYDKKLSNGKRVCRIKLWQNIDKIAEDAEAPVTEVQARRAKVVARIYADMTDEDKLSAYLDPAFRRLFRSAGFTANDGTRAYMMRQAVADKIKELDEVDRKEVERIQAEGGFVYPPADAQIPFR